MALQASQYLVTQALHNPGLLPMALLSLRQVKGAGGKGAPGAGGAGAGSQWPCQVVAHK